MPRLTSTALSERLINNTTASAQEIVLRDASTRGLLVRIAKTGTKSFAFEYRSPITGKTTRLTLGGAGEGGIGLAAARTLAAQHRATVSAGRCPAREARTALEAARIEHASAQTVARALDLYEAAVITPHPRTISRQARMVLLRRVCEPWSKMAVKSLGRGMIMQRLDEVARERGPVQGNRAQSYLRHLLGWLHEAEIVNTIAIDRVRKRHKEVSRERILSKAERAVTLKAIRSAPELAGTAFADIVEVLLATGMRRGEAASLQSRDIDPVNGTATVRAEVSKNHRSRVVPLVGKAREIVERRARGVRKTGFIFGDGTVGARPFSGWGKSLARLRSIAGVIDEGVSAWTLHDIRRTVATGLIDAGVDTLVTEDLLGHLTGARAGVAGTYNRSNTLGRQAKALEAWVSSLEVDANCFDITKIAAS